MDIEIGWRRKKGISEGLGEELAKRDGKGIRGESREEKFSPLSQGKQLGTLGEGRATGTRGMNA